MSSTSPQPPVNVSGSLFTKYFQKYFLRKILHTFFLEKREFFMDLAPLLKCYVAKVIWKCWWKEILAVLILEERKQRAMVSLIERYQARGQILQGKAQGEALLEFTLKSDCYLLFDFPQKHVLGFFFFISDWRYMWFFYWKFPNSMFWVVAQYCGEVVLKCQKCEKYLPLCWYLE